MIDLTDTSIYPSKDGKILIPDGHVEIALKVIRTIRNVYLGPEIFDANTAVVLSHAHKEVHDFVKTCWIPEPTVADRQLPG